MLALSKSAIYESMQRREDFEWPIRLYYSTTGAAMHLFGQDMRNLFNGSE